MRIRCSTCGKVFSGDRQRVVAVTKCPKCGATGSWWDQIPDTEDKSGRSKVPATSSPLKPLPKPDGGSSPNAAQSRMKDGVAKEPDKGSRSLRSIAGWSRSGLRFKLFALAGLLGVASLLGVVAIMSVGANKRATDLETARISAISVAEDVLLEASHSAAREAFGSDDHNDRFHRYVLDNGQPPGNAELARWDSRYDPLALREFLRDAKPGEPWKPAVPIQERFKRRAEEEYAAVWAYELLSILKDPIAFKEAFLPHLDAYIARRERMKREGVLDGEITINLAFFVFEAITTEEMDSTIKARILRM
jgi:phage FluMu protein Com